MHVLLFCLWLENGEIKTCKREHKTRWRAHAARCSPREQTEPARLDQLTHPGASAQIPAAQREIRRRRARRAHAPHPFPSGPSFPFPIVFLPFSTECSLAPEPPRTSSACLCLHPPRRHRFIHASSRPAAPFCSYHNTTPFF